MVTKQTTAKLQKVDKDYYVLEEQFFPGAFTRTRNLCLE